MRPLLGVLLIAGVAAAKWDTLLGGDEKRIIASGHNPPDTSMMVPLRGRVVLQVLWSEKTAGDLLPLLEELWKRHHRAGLRILAATRAPAATVDALQEKEQYSFTLYPGADLKPFGDGAFPYALLLDAGGKYVWQGPPEKLTDKRIAKLLKKADLFWLPDAARTASKAQKLFFQGKLGLAFYESEVAKRNRTAFDLGPGIIHNQVGAIRNYWMKLASLGRARGDYELAEWAYGKLIRHLGKDHPKAESLDLSTGHGDRAKILLDGLPKLEEGYERGMKAAMALRPLVEQFWRKGTKPSNAALVKKLDAFAVEWSGTYAATRAARLSGLVAAR